MAAKELTIAVLLIIVIGSNGDLYSNHNYNYNSNYAYRPLFMFKPKLPQTPSKPLTRADLLALFDATGYTMAAWTSAGAVANQGPTAVKTALGSYPANVHAALQALVNAPSEVAQLFMFAGPQFNLVDNSLRNGMTDVISQIYNSINEIVDNAESVSDPVVIQKLTNVFDLLRYLATVIFNLKVQVSSATEENVKVYIARIHSTMAQMLDGMISYMAYVASFEVSKEKMNSFLGFIYSKVLQLEVKPCSRQQCSELSQFLPAVKSRALDALNLYRP